MSIYCTECGKQLDDDSKFCKYCGKDLCSMPTKPKTWTEMKTFTNVEYANRFLRQHNNIVNAKIMASSHSACGFVANRIIIDDITVFITMSETYYPIVYQIGIHDYISLVFPPFKDLMPKIQRLNPWAHLVSMHKWQSTRTNSKRIGASAHTTICCLYTQDINDYQQLRYK